MFVKFIILVVFFTLVSARRNSDELWEKFKIDFNKNYSKSVETMARKVFEENLIKIQNHNLKYQKGLSSWRMGINEFSDENFYDSQTFNSEPNTKACIQNGSQKEINELDDGSLIEKNLAEFSNFETNEKIPKSFDWRDNIKMGEVKNQGKCRSCYAFAAVGVVESLIYRQTSKHVDLSEQEIIDCGRGFATAGCNFGAPFGVMAYIIKNGLSYEHNYPYTGKKGHCRRNETTMRYQANFTKILAPFYNKSSEESLMNHVYLHGPVSFKFYVTESFVKYSDGIYYEKECGKSSASHIMLLVGYGSEKGEDYWIVKNSWGSTWGEQGYVRIARNKQNHCEIATWVISIT